MTNPNNFFKSFSKSRKGWVFIILPLLLQLAGVMTVYEAVLLSEVSEIALPVETIDEDVELYADTAPLEMPDMPIDVSEETVDVQPPRLETPPINGGPPINPIHAGIIRGSELPPHVATPLPTARTIPPPLVQSPKPFQGPKGPQPLAPQLTCGVISTSDVYTLENNITSNTTCLTINVSNVNLDCQGYTINYGLASLNRSFGVISTVNTNVTVKNCVLVSGSVNRFNHAIYYNNSNQGMIENNTITTNSSKSHGIILLDLSNSNVVKDNTITTLMGGSDGIYIIKNSSSNNITGNTISTYKSGSGIRFHKYANFNAVENNVITNSFGVGIIVGGRSSSNTLKNNTISRTNYSISSWSAPAILLADNNGNTVDSNTITLKNGGNAIEVVNSRSNTINGNTLDVPGRGGGISFALYARSNTIKDNTITAENPINTEGITTRLNTFYNNIFNTTLKNVSGIHLEGPHLNTWNTARQNSTTNIIGGNTLGGNYWANTNGTGYSETCTDTDNDDICDGVYTIGTSHSTSPVTHKDYLPLAKP